MLATSRLVCSTVVILMTLSAIVAGLGCGGKQLPTRGVIEGDVAHWEFRRYQKVLDLEVWVPDNDAVAHTASYVDTGAERRGTLASEDVVSAFVTRFERDEGVEEAVWELARRLRREPGYRVEEGRAARGAALVVRGPGELWTLWPSGAHVVKVGGRGRESVPSEVVDAYARLYPSTLSRERYDPNPIGTR